MVNKKKQKKMIFISKRYLQKDVKRHSLYEMEMEKQKQKIEMKVENERDISEHKSWKRSVREKISGFYYMQKKVKTSQTKKTMRDRLGRWLAACMMKYN